MLFSCQLMKKTLFILILISYSIEKRSLIMTENMPSVTSNDQRKFFQKNILVLIEYENDS